MAFRIEETPDHKRLYQFDGETEALSAMSEGLRNFAQRYNYAINDPDLIRRYRMIEDGKRDIATKIAVAEEKAEARGKEIGESIGEARGEAKKNRDNAKGFKEQGIDPAIISKVTGLSLEEIAAL